MKTGSIFLRRQFNKGASAAVFALIINILLLISDSILSGYFFSEDAVAGIAAITPIFSVVTFIAILLSEGVEMLYPYEMGKMAPEKASNYFNTSFWACLGAGLLILIITTVGKNPYFDSLELTGDVRFYADEYLSLIKWTYTILPVWTLLSFVVLMDGDNTLYNCATAFLFFANIFFSIILAKNYGIKGVAIGTLIADSGTLIIFCLHFLKKNTLVKINLHFNFQELLHISRFGIIDAANYLYGALLGYFVNWYIVEKMGQGYLATHNVVTAVIDLSILFDGIGDGIFRFIGTYRGEGNYPAMKDTMNHSYKLGIFASIIVSAITFLIAPYSPEFFSIESPVYKEATIFAVRVVSVSMTARCFESIIMSYYVTIEKIWLSFILTTIMYFIGFIIGFMIFLPLSPANGLWYSISAGPFIGFAAGMLLTRIILKKDKFPYILDVDNPDIRNFGLVLSDDAIITLRNEAGAVLAEKKTDTKTANFILLMIEECFMLIREKNPGKKITAELSLFLEDEIRLIFRDDGVIFDMTDTDDRITSFRSYIVSNLMKHQHDKVYQITTEYNRNMFTFSRL